MERKKIRFETLVKSIIQSAICINSFTRLILVRSLARSGFLRAPFDFLTARILKGRQSLCGDPIMFFFCTPPQQPAQFSPSLTNTSWYLVANISSSTLRYKSVDPCCCLKLLLCPCPGTTLRLYRASKSPMSTLAWLLWLNTFRCLHVPSAFFSVAATVAGHAS